MKKIMIISTSSELGGGPMHILSLLRSLSSSYEFYLAMPKDGAVAPDLRENCVSSFDIPADKFSVVAALHLIVFILKHNIKIIHSHGKGGGVYSRFVKIFLWSINVIHTYHGIHYEKYGKFKKLLYKNYEKLSINLNSKVVFVSDSEQIKLETFLGKSVSRSCVIANGTKVMLNACDVIANFCKRMARIRITFVGRLDPIKNVMSVLDLARILDANDSTFKITVVGDGCQKDHFLAEMCKLKLKSSNKISYFGASNDVFGVLKETDILFNSSLSEGHPLTLLEAMSVSVICLASNVTGNKDIIEHNVDGLLYPLNDVNQAANLLREIQNNVQRKDQLILNAWIKHRKKFTDEKCFEELKAHYAIL